MPTNRYCFIGNKTILITTLPLVGGGAYDAPFPISLPSGRPGAVPYPGISGGNGMHKSYSSAMARFKPRMADQAIQCYTTLCGRLTPFVLLVYYFTAPNMTKITAADYMISGCFHLFDKSDLSNGCFSTR